MSARELVKHVLSLVGFAEVTATRGARRLASVTFYESAPIARPRRHSADGPR